MSAAVPSLPDDAEAFGVSFYGPRLLLWVWDRAEGELDVPVSCAEFGSWQSIPLSAVRSLIDHLSGQSLIRAHGRRTDAPVVTLLAAGAERARQLQVRRADPAERGRHAVKAVLQWIYAQADRRPLRISGFLDSPGAYFLGEALSRGEVARTLSYLAEAGLITCEGPAFHNGVGSHVELTPLGVEAVHNSGEPDQYLARQREQTRPTSQTHIRADTVNYADEGGIHNNIRNNVRNNIEIHAGMSPADLARLVGELAPALQLDAESRAALLRAAGALAQRGDTDDEPERDRQAGLMERMRRLLGGAPDTVGRQLMLDSIGQALGRLLGG